MLCLPIELEALEIEILAGTEGNDAIRTSFFIPMVGDRRDLNPRPPVPQTGALPG